MRVRVRPRVRVSNPNPKPSPNQAPGVVYHGMVSETELAQAYAQAGWYAYPSDKPETSGIALMKAQVRVRL